MRLLTASGLWNNPVRFNQSPGKRIVLDRCVMGMLVPHLWPLLRDNLTRVGDKEMQQSRGWWRRLNALLVVLP
jgi:hypothetical protein